MTPPAQADALTLPLRRPPARAVLSAMRPRQWPKNLLLFAGVVFAGEVGRFGSVGAAALAFAAYTLASGASYLVNDVHDAAADRMHHAKRARPVARRELSPRTAVMVALSAAGVAVGVMAQLGPRSVALLMAFLALQVLYTTRLRAVVLVDVVAIATLFVIRAAAGAVAVDVRISPWLLACTFLLALLLAVGKRHAERHHGSFDGPTRETLVRYRPTLLWPLTVAMAIATSATYAAYTLVGAHSRLLVLTLPLVAFGVGRYVVLVGRHRAGEDPETILLEDAPMLATVACWAAVCVLALSA